MNGDTPIAEFRGPWGIPVQVQPSIIFLALLFVGLSVGSAKELLDGLIFFGIVVASILAHEFGHAWGARVQGIPVLRVVLHGGGGYCQHRSASPHASELIVIMGPLVNLALWAMLSIGGDVLWSFPSDTASSMATQVARIELGYWLLIAADINLVLFVLNMIPVQPLDGGRLLHLWLMRVMPVDRSTRVAGGIGLVCTVLWIPGMIYAYVTLGFLLLFLPSLRQHWEMLRTKSRLRRARF